MYCKQTRSNSDEIASQFTGCTNLSSAALKLTNRGLILRAKNGEQRYEDLVRFSCGALEFCAVLRWIARYDNQSRRVVPRGPRRSEFSGQGRCQSLHAICRQV